ncbi:SAM-dependent methyltransferase [Streptomyces sp. PTM05]|uniref:SAM-dependent methyltransferase n=1 Tax=Streptantibioticus parmotrematis TaxID=2873249 RepID=A0ABS7QY44_9ACTN|nr:SAM-dependent methyltransferase [Streptantibioticus parmotrematis]MBY8887569.1 SAM-dependent methyltransferase [Streptantibioticus parmotrematis]
MSEQNPTGAGFPVERIDTSKPHPARMYDYYLGGWDNYEVDRVAAEQVITMAPEARASARANRAFLGRAVRTVVRSGIRQVIDIGTGIPTSPNTHEVAREIDPSVRVAYVDNDPIVATHAGAKLTDTGQAGFALADVRDPKSILDSPLVRELIDFDQPVALLFVAVLHFIKDAEDPVGILRAFTERLAPGSHLVLTHGTTDFHRDAEGDAREVYRNATAHLTLRGYDEILPFFDGFDLLEPGVVQAPLWRPEGALPEASELHRIAFYAGVGVKE